MNARTRFVCAGGGPLSVDSARLALANWLLARGGAGSFVLRAGPADRAGVDLLRWLGLDWDAGPERPADRDEVCRDQAERLLREERAYRCDCTSLPCRNACRDLSRAQWQSFEAVGRRPAIYLDGTVCPAGAWEDGIYGAQEPAAVGDLLLLDADGRPSPLLACAVDDHMDGITDVIAASRQMSQSAAQRALHDALGWPTPRFAHLPDLEPGTADRTLAEYRDRGYGALSMANHLARQGWTPRGRRRLLALPELAAQYDMHAVSRQPAAADAGPLDWFNRRWLDGLDDEAYLALLRPYWWAAYGQPDRAAGTTLAPEAWQRQLAATMRGQVHVPAEAAALARPLFVDRVLPGEDAARLLAESWAGAVLRAFCEGLPAVMPFAFAPLDQWVSALRWRFKEEKSVRSRDVMYLLRAALTGQVDGPCLIVDCLLLGRARCMARALAALAIWEGTHG